jgi:hypothetical protein
MPHPTGTGGFESDDASGHARRQFVGFAAPTSNTTYVPNQFFDVCLPHYSRGTVRVVAFMIRKSLGWCDANGEPQEKRRVVSYAEFEKVGVSRDMIRRALDEASAGHFIHCLRKPSPNRAGMPSVSGLYELKWDEGTQYIKDPKHFRGFFAGEGNRTYIPNEFLDRVVPTEPLAVAKVVGAVIRLSIGFQNKWGHRRRNVALSFQHIQNYTRIKDRTTLANAVQYALIANYIERVEEGYFDPNGGKRSKAAIYALRWLNGGLDSSNGQKTRPADGDELEQSENHTGNGQKTRPAERSENHTDIEIKQRNKTLKQQDAAVLELLRGEGFDERAAQAIASSHSFERVERQIRWLPLRQIKSNRLGLLRAAIQGDWPAPGIQLGAPNRERERQSGERGDDFAAAINDARRRFLGNNH